MFKGTKAQLEDRIKRLIDAITPIMASQDPEDQKRVAFLQGALDAQKKALEETEKIQKLSEANMEKINSASEAEQGDAEKRQQEEDVK